MVFILLMYTTSTTYFPLNSPPPFCQLNTQTITVLWFRHIHVLGYLKSGHGRIGFVVCSGFSFFITIWNFEVGRYFHLLWYSILCYAHQGVLFKTLLISSFHDDNSVKGNAYFCQLKVEKKRRYQDCCLTLYPCNIIIWDLGCWHRKILGGIKLHDIFSNGNVTNEMFE